MLFSFQFSWIFDGEGGGLSCIWACLHYRGLCVPGGVYTTGPELHLDVSAPQRSLLLLEVSTLKGPELHLDVSALQRSLLLLEVSKLQGPELHRDVSALQRS
jgi:hypothetical protein